jgi:hypothetical protein
MNDLDDEVFEFCFVHKLGRVIGAIGKQMLDPGPATADGVQDELGASTVSDVRINRKNALFARSDPRPMGWLPKLSK